MLEYFAYKKFKKNKAEKEEAAKQNGAKSPTSASTKREGSSAATVPATTAARIPLPTSPEHSTSAVPQITGAPTPVLKPEDEAFFERITSSEGADDDDGFRPPLPPRVKTPNIEWETDDESMMRIKGKDKGKGKETAHKALDTAQSGIKNVGNRLSLLLKRSPSTADKKKVDKKAGGDSSHLTVPDAEVDQESNDLARVLDDLNLSARNGTAFTLSKESSELVQKFTLVLKDLVNGVPTAANDLTSLLNDTDGTLAKNYEKLPKSLKKLVTQLPDKLTGSLAPELLAVAAAAQGKGEAEYKDANFKDAAKRLLTPKNIQELVTKPGAVVGMLKGIMNALKLRWPAFIGTNVIWSVAVFLLLFVLWYCHKRGREVRLGKEQTVDGSSRIEELPDDPALPAPPVASSSGRRSPIAMEASTSSPTTVGKTAKPPVKDHKWRA